jgi:hypothetical protein
MLAARTGWERQMSDRSRKARVAGLAVVVAVTLATLLVPGTAHARPGSPGGYRVEPSSTGFVSMLTQNEWAGDCEEYGSPDPIHNPTSYVVVRNSNGDLDITWEANTRTNKTHTGDIWHQYFDVYADDWTLLRTFGPFDSTTMWVQPGYYYTSLTLKYYMPPELFAAIRFIDWYGYC